MKTDIAPNLPKSVFKFYSATKNSFEAFNKHYLFISHPYHLNDLMDGNIYTLDLRNISNAQYEVFKQQIIQQAPQIRDKAIWQKLNPGSDPQLIQLQNAIMASYFSYGGIVSLTTQNRFNELMWSHYTSESGFMIEFDTNQLINSIVKDSRNNHIKKIYFKPIEYKQNPISISCLRYQNIEHINIYNATQKNDEWAYEKEWRLILTSSLYMGLPQSIYADASDHEITNINNRKVYYSDQAIKNIYLGKKFWERPNAKKEILQNSNKDIKIYEVTSEITTLINELCNYRERIYMSGVCPCSEYRYGTDEICYKEYSDKIEFNSNICYLKRSFDTIKDISIYGNKVHIKYEGKVKTSNEEFEQ